MNISRVRTGIREIQEYNQSVSEQGEVTDYSDIINLQRIEYQTDCRETIQIKNYHTEKYGDGG